MSSSIPSTCSKKNHNERASTFSIDLSHYDALASRPCPVPDDLIEKVKNGIKKHLSPSGELLNLYVWGSRFYLNHTSNSDYDLVAIVTGTPYKCNFQQEL